MTPRGTRARSQREQITMQIKSRKQAETLKTQHKKSLQRAQRTAAVGKTVGTRGIGVQCVYKGGIEEPNFHKNFETRI